jgi:hypothetical protein
MKRTNNTTIIIMVVMVAVMLSLFSSMTAAAKQAPQDIGKSSQSVYCTTSMAAITDCQIIGESGGTVGMAKLRLRWTYAATGVKPYKLLITVYRLQGLPPGSWDNIMPSGQAFNVPSPATTTDSDVMIWRLFSGDYRIVLKAFYTCNRVKEYMFERHI